MTQPWASTVNYPAGGNPWNGHATKVAPAYTYFTPGQAPAAEELNYLLNQLGNQIGAIAATVWMEAVSNWNPTNLNIGSNVVTNPPGNAPFCACWDPFYQQWLVGCATTTSLSLESVQATYDGGKTWFGLQPVLPSATVRLPFAIAVRPSDGVTNIMRSDGTTVSNTRYSGGASSTRTNADTTQAFLTFSGAGVTQGVMAYFNSAFWFVGNTAVSAVSWTGGAASSTDGSGTWTNQTSGLPAGFASSTTNAISQYLAAQSATTLVVAMCSARAGTDTSRLMSQTSGTWTDITPGVLGGTAKAIRGIAYDAIDQLWGLFAQDASGNAYIYSSPDLSTWTLCQTFTGYNALGFTTLGSVWVVLVYEQAIAEGTNRILFSSNVAANGASSTWFAADYTDQGVQSGVNTINLSTLLSSGQQVLRMQSGGTANGGALQLLSGSVSTSLKAVISSVVPGSTVAGTTLLGINFEANGTGTANDPHITANFVGSGITTADAGGGVVTITIPTGGALSLVRVNHAGSPLTLSSGQRAMVDVSAGVVTINAPASPNDNDRIAVTNVLGSAATNNITVAGNGHNIEDPNTPGTYSASVLVKLLSGSVDWMFDATNSRWKVI